MFQRHHVKWHNSKLIVCRLYWYLQKHRFSLVLLFESHTVPPSLAASSGFFWCWFWRCKVSVLFMWQADLSNSLTSSGFKWLKHELLPRREEGCSEHNSFSPKVWTLDAVAGWNERAANQLLPFPLLTSRHCIPISHRTAVYNPHLQALLLKLQQQETLSQANTESSCLGQTTFLAQPFPMSREAALLELRVFLPGWRHVSTTLWCTWWWTGTPRERPGVG